MKMPFEVLMEHVVALTDEDKELPMGKLSERWGEPASRIADAIDAVRVMRGERTYITMGPDLILPVTVDDRVPPGRVVLAGRDLDGKPSVAVMDNVGGSEP